MLMILLQSFFFADSSKLNSRTKKKEPSHILLLSRPTEREFPHLG